VCQYATHYVIHGSPANGWIVIITTQDDWLAGLHYRTLSSGLFVFFSSIGPAVTFGAVISDSTEGQLGVVEVILASALGGVFMSLFAGQPLVIVGVTGPIAIFTATVHTFAKSLGIPFLQVCFSVVSLGFFRTV
jgi:hypothetical protein